MVCAAQLRLQNGGAYETMRVVCRTYAAFLEQVSVGRKMDMTEVRSLARGRVGSGQEAFQHGLVNSPWSLSDDIITAKRLQAELPRYKLLVHFSITT